MGKWLAIDDFVFVSEIWNNGDYDYHYYALYCSVYVRIIMWGREKRNGGNECS